MQPTSPSVSHETFNFISNIRNAVFWRTQFPMLTMTEGGEHPVPNNSIYMNVEELRAPLIKDGYIDGSSDYLLATMPALAEAIHKCKALQIPPPFLFLFDEPWACFRQLYQLLKDILGEDYKLLPDFWVWHLDYTKGENGWGPHRDKGPYALDAEGMPLSLTVWMPITEATPENGCMYMVPAHLDRGYHSAKGSGPDFDFASIRALPRKPGDFLAWNQAVMHWGAKSSNRAQNARMSMALEFQRGDIAPYNQPLLSPLDNLNFHARLLLVAKQILQYQHMYALPPEMREVAEKLIQGK